MTMFATDGEGEEELRLSYLEAANPAVWNQNLPRDGVLFASDFAWVAAARRQNDEKLVAALNRLSNALFDPLPDWRETLAQCLREVRENTGSVRFLQIQLIRFLDELHQRASMDGGQSELEEDEVAILNQSRLEPVLCLAEKHCVAFRARLDSLRRTRSQVIIDQAVRYLEEHYADSELSLGTLADQAGISLTYLSGLFTSELGENFQHCLLRMRMEAAKKLMEQGTFKGYEIAEKVGFSNPYYFGACFKKYTGYTLSEYRREGASPN